VIVMHRAQDKSRQDEFTKRSHDSFKLWFPRMSALIVGPGLGRDPAVLACAVVAIREAASLSIPIVIDADGLFLLCQQPEILDGYRHVVLTPNTAELKRLVDNLKITTDERRSPSRYSHVSASTKVPVNPETVQQGLALSARSVLKFCVASHCCSPWDLECSLLRFEGVTVYCKGTTDAIVCQPPGGSKSTLFLVIESFTFLPFFPPVPCRRWRGDNRVWRGSGQSKAMWRSRRCCIRLHRNLPWLGEAVSETTRFQRRSGLDLR
jgi:hypothetical protein